ncbi:TetR/AcrR family transcriptional regulator [Phenylobacterium sp.]|uniref:TetR/AcrR family transcriptional regulator n=1 Tax=Phenylobacterium sp. TaxID=1871053 RepID=UPI0025E1A5D2|nr:TetR/AcrR family transcriptional regulator [Phenylobacterium sp.]
MSGAPLGDMAARPSDVTLQGGVRDGAEDVVGRHTPRVEQILSAATRLFNRHTFAGMTMEAIAAALEITPSTLHYHFPDKDTLVFRCHQRGLAMYARELEHAAVYDVDALEKVRRFIRHRLAPSRPRMIGFSDLGSLSPAYRRMVMAARQRNVDTLAGLIKAGVDAGEIATSDPYLCSVGVFSVLDWMPYWYSERDYYSRQGAADMLDDLLTYGMLRRDAEVPTWPSPPDLSMLFPDTSAGRRELKRDQLLQVATESFNTRGVAGTSMELLAGDAGVSRNAFYYHAKDKAALLYLCLERAFAHETSVAEAVIDAHLRPPITAATAAITEVQLHRAFHLLHASPYGPKCTFHNVNYLSPDAREAVMALNRAIESKNRGRYADCMDAGAYRKLDSFFMQQVGAGLRNHLPLWGSLTAGRDPITIADNHAELMLLGLKPR